LGKQGWSGLPDIIYSLSSGSALPTTLIGSKIYSFSEVSSTNTIAIQMAHEGAPEGTVVIADQQHHGRGQRGRAWYSPGGVGIYMSVILRPHLPPENISQLTLITALALAEAVAAATGLKPGIVWPNDVFINGHKLAGILAEAEWEEANIRHLVIGIGVNVNHTREMFIENHLPEATSLKVESGHEYSRAKLVRKILLNLEERYLEFLSQGFEPIGERLQELDGTVGSWLEVISFGNRFEGESLGIDSTAALLVRVGEVVRRITSGRIKILYNNYHLISHPSISKNSGLSFL